MEYMFKNTSRTLRDLKYKLWNKKKTPQWYFNAHG